MDYKSVGMFIAADGRLIVIAQGVSEKFGGATVNLNTFHILEHGYTDEQIESIVLQAFEEWNSSKPNDTPAPTVIEKALNVKGYLKAIKGMRCVHIGWDIDDGYYIAPTVNTGKKGFIDIENGTVKLGLSIQKGDLAEGIKKAIHASR